jgi:hypothetical protein
MPAAAASLSPSLDVAGTQPDGFGDDVYDATEENLRSASR